MKWLLIVGGALVALALLVALVGAILPVAHTASVRADIRASPEEAFAALADFEGHPTWLEGVQRVERLPDLDGRPVWREVSKFGAMDMAIDESVPGRRLVTRLVGEGKAFGGSWSFDLEPRNGGSRITVTERGEVYNPIFRFMSRFVFGYHATMEGYLRSLGRRFGQEVETVRVPS